MKAWKKARKGKPMIAQIVEVHKNDAYYHDRDKLIGLTGHWQETTSWDDGWEVGTFILTTSHPTHGDVLVFHKAHTIPYAPESLDWILGVMR